jgi:hypothetical protein
MPGKRKSVPSIAQSTPTTGTLASSAGVEPLNSSNTECLACGTVQPSSQGSFCVGCGEKLEFASAKHAISGDAGGQTNAFTSLGKKEKRNILIGAAVLLVGLGVAAYLFVPRTVLVEITVDDLYGGVFDASCQPTSHGKAVLPMKVNVSNDSGVLRKDIAVEYDEFTGACSGQVELSLPPLGEYRVASGADTIAIIESQEVFAGSDSGSVEAAVYRTIKGTFSLHDDANRCRDKGSYTHCWWNDWFGIDMPRNGNTDCQGMNGYSDIYPGTGVYIYGNSNGQSAYSTLGFGYETWPTGGDVTITCTFDWAPVTIPYDEFGYSVEVSSRGSLSFSLEEIEYSDGIVSTYLGTP